MPPTSGGRELAVIISLCEHVGRTTRFPSVRPSVSYGDYAYWSCLLWLMFDLPRSLNGWNEYEAWCSLSLFEMYWQCLSKLKWFQLSPLIHIADWSGARGHVQTVYWSAYIGSYVAAAWNVQRRPSLLELNDVCAVLCICFALFCTGSGHCSMDYGAIPFI